MVDYDMKMIGLKPVGEGINICEKKKFTYTNHDFSFYEKIRERNNLKINISFELWV